jgi:hypothetical protein
MNFCLSNSYLKPGHSLHDVYQYTATILKKPNLYKYTLPSDHYTQRINTVPTYHSNLAIFTNWVKSTWLLFVIPPLHTTSAQPGNLSRATQYALPNFTHVRNHTQLLHNLILYALTPRTSAYGNEIVHLRWHKLVNSELLLTKPSYSSSYAHVALYSNGLHIKTVM